MSVFQEVIFGFKGEEYTVPANKVMKLIAEVEDIVSLGDLTTGRGPHISKLAAAYCYCINYAGGKATIEQVYETLFGVDENLSSATAVTNLIALMVPPSSYQPDTESTGKLQAAE